MLKNGIDTLHGAATLSEKTIEPLKDFSIERAFIDPEVPEELRERHEAIAKKLEDIEEGHEKLEKRRVELRDAIIKEFEISSLEKLKQIPWRRMELFQKEIAARTELQAWFADYSSAMNKIHEDARAELEAAIKEVRDSIVKIGYEEGQISHHLKRDTVADQGGHKTLIAMHPKVVAAKSRFDRLGDRRTWSMNPGVGGNPRSANEHRGRLVEHFMEIMLQRAISLADSL